MRLHPTLVALLLVGTPSAPTGAQDQRPHAEPTPELAPAAAANPLASFARMVSGEWRVTYANGTSQFDAWSFGPGERSLRALTHGTDAAGNPWRELLLVYWHPGREQVRLLGMHPHVESVGRGVMEGTIRFDGETADATFDLYQRGPRRRMGLRWTFDGPDEYRETLSEATGSAGFAPLAEWEYSRSETITPIAEAPQELPERLEILASLLGPTWEAELGSAAGNASRLRSTCEWIPHAEVICARTFALIQDGEPTHVLDAYLYHHTGTDALHCLALSSGGDVHEGVLSVLADGALQLELKSYEKDRLVPHEVRFVFEADGTLRSRVWALEGTERTLSLDLRHEKRAPKED